MGHTSDQTQLELESTMDHLLTVTFDSHGAARSALDQLHDNDAAELTDACVASRDMDGIIEVAVIDGAQTMHADLWQRLVHSLTYDDSVAGLPTEFSQQVAASLQPGRAALFALTNGADLDPLKAKLSDGDQTLTCDLGDGGREEFVRRIETLPEDPRGDDPMVWQAGFGSFQ